MLTFACGWVCGMATLAAIAFWGARNDQRIGAPETDHPYYNALIKVRP